MGPAIHHLGARGVTENLQQMGDWAAQNARKRGGRGPASSAIRRVALPRPRLGALQERLEIGDVVCRSTVYRHVGRRCGRAMRLT